MGLSEASESTLIDGMEFTASSYSNVPKHPTWCIKQISLTSKLLDSNLPFKKISPVRNYKYNERSR